MNLFRSEEHVNLWQQRRSTGGDGAGETISIVTACDLATAWWSECLSPDWAPGDADEFARTFSALGLTSAFWQMGAGSQRDLAGSH